LSPLIHIYRKQDVSWRGEEWREQARSCRGEGLRRTGGRLREKRKFGAGGLRKGAAFLGIARAELGELVGGDSSEMRGRVDEERAVSTAEIF
jgi:hypothetical protein